MAFAVAALAVTFVSSAEAQTFSFRKQITVDFNQVSGPTNHTDFPVLIDITGDLQLRTVANGGNVQNANGYDIVFTDSSGTELDFEIERYDGSNGDLRAWVRVPTLSVSANTILHVNYGDASITTSQESPCGVFDKNYVGAWHLEESGSGVANEFKGSSNYQDHGQGGEGDPLFVPTRVGGKIGFAQDFNNLDGKYDLIDVGTCPRLDITGDQITLQAWIKHNIVPAPSVFYGILNHKGFNQGYRIVIPQNVNAIQFQLGTGKSLVGSTVTPTNNWTHVVATYDGATMKIYIDGVKDPTELATTGNIPTEFDNATWIGHGDQPKDVPWSYEWEGQIDEVRISNIARDAGWIATEYNNQETPSTFYTVGGETPGPFAVGTLTINYRSIGANSGILYNSGDAQLPIGTTVVAFGGVADLPTTIGRGDELILNPGAGPLEETLYILSRDTATQVRVQTAATINHVPPVPYEIRRAHNVLQTWEDNSDGDLVGQNRREVGIRLRRRTSPCRRVAYAPDRRLHHRLHALHAPHRGPGTRALRHRRNRRLSGRRR